MKKSNDIDVLSRCDYLALSLMCNLFLPVVSKSLYHALHAYSKCGCNHAKHIPFSSSPKKAPFLCEHCNVMSLITYLPKNEQAMS